MDFDAIYHFLFETYAGIGILVGAGLLISLIYAIIAERKTRRVYRDRGNKSDDSDDQLEFEENDTSSHDENNKNEQ